jgi:hypothetical protein
MKSIENTDLRATFDKSTQWPDGFDPVKAGAVLVDPQSEQVK